MRDALADVGWNTVWPALGSRFMDAVGQGRERRTAGFEDFVRIFVAQLIKREARTGIEYADGIFQRFGIRGEKPRHFLRALEAAFAVAVGGKSDAVDRRAEADGRQHIGEAAAVGMMVAGIGRRQQPNAGDSGHGRERFQALAVGPVASHGRRA
jgi:hypothetical protein